MRVAAVQFKPVKGDVAAALEHLAALADQAAENSDLVVLPEMAATGYCFETRQELAALAEASDGPTFAALAPIAAHHGCWIVAGFPEVSGDDLFNSALVINPQGELAFTYRKTLLFERDEHWATVGNSGYRAFDTPNGRFGVGICMDLNDDVFVKWCEQADLDVIAFPTNWLEQGTPVWQYWAWRLQHVRAALVAANTYGPEADIQFWGRSAVLKERILYATAPEAGDGIIRATVPVVHTKQG